MINNSIIENEIRSNEKTQKYAGLYWTHLQQSSKLAVIWNTVRADLHPIPLCTLSTTLAYSKGGPAILIYHLY